VSYDTALMMFVALRTRQLQGIQGPVASSNILPMGVLVPARNEAQALAATLTPLLAQLAVGDTLLLVDDGSTDRTRQVLAQDFGVQCSGLGWVQSSRYPALQVLFKVGSGKADSLNAAWPLLPQPVIVTMDADTLVCPGALAAFRAGFAAEPSWVAACGVLQPRTQGGWLAAVFQRFQVLEYRRAFLARAAWMRSDALLLVSGAFAAYRRAALVAVGGFDRNSLVEDYELIHRLYRHAADHGLHWQVRVVHAALASTDAPASFRAFLHRRHQSG
jgi:cellulose synthase/poly-beta-1,6-N-acetylglucosamine synthase-like glycosyltransferase